LKGIIPYDSDYKIHDDQPRPCDDRPKIQIHDCTQCTLGWVDIGTSTGVQSGFVYLHEKNTEHGKNVFFWSSDLLRKGHSFLCQALCICNGQKFFFSQYGVDGYQKMQN
jgi:hypothetical protein